MTFSYGRHAIRPFVVTTLWQTHAYIEVLKKKPLGLYGGHDWDWTSDPYDVNVVLSRWATRPIPNNNSILLFLVIQVNFGRNTIYG